MAGKPKEEIHGRANTSFLTPKRLPISSNSWLVGYRESECHRHFHLRPAIHRFRRIKHFGHRRPECAGPAQPESVLYRPSNFGIGQRQKKRPIFRPRCVLDTDGRNFRKRRKKYPHGPRLCQSRFLGGEGIPRPGKCERAISCRIF